jgi:hypothetical protein
MQYIMPDNINILLMMLFGRVSKTNKVTYHCVQRLPPLLPAALLFFKHQSCSCVSMGMGLVKGVSTGELFHCFSCRQVPTLIPLTSLFGIGRFSWKGRSAAV